MYNTWKQMVQFSDEHDCAIEDIQVKLNQVLQTKTAKLPTAQAKKIESISNNTNKNENIIYFRF
jgi:hypothetical protein